MARHGRVQDADAAVVVVGLDPYYLATFRDTPDGLGECVRWRLQVGLLAHDLSEVVSKERLELGFALVFPPKSLRRKVLLELQHESPLVGLLFRLRRIWLLRKVNYDLRLAAFLPRLVRDAEFMLGAGLGVADQSAEAPPENADQDVASIDLQDWVDEPLRP